VEVTVVLVASVRRSEGQLQAFMQQAGVGELFFMLRMQGLASWLQKALQGSHWVCTGLDVSIGGDAIEERERGMDGWSRMQSAT
jgi:hypothetical protein